MNDQRFDQQIDTYVAAGFAASAGLDETGFRARIEPLRPAFEAAPAGEFSPAIVLTRAFATAEQLVRAIDRTDGKPDTLIRADALKRYRPRPGIELPSGDAYLVIGASKEPATRGMTPTDALGRFAKDGRSPLTIEEGLAIWHLHPDAIARNDGISLAGSSRGDRRVPAIWISKGQPKLGWCFAGAPHSWLATASCSGRIGPVN